MVCDRINFLRVLLYLSCPRVTILYINLLIGPYYTYPYYFIAMPVRYVYNLYSYIPLLVWKWWREFIPSFNLKYNRVRIVTFFGVKSGVRDLGIILRRTCTAPPQFSSASSSHPDSWLCIGSPSPKKFIDTFKCRWILFNICICQWILFNIILFLQAWTMADMTTLIVISSFIMFPAVMMAQEVVNHGGND